MKHRLVGLLLWALLFVPALVAFVAVPLVILFAPQDWAKSALRAFDELPSACLFGGSAYMSLSAWSWQCRTTWWARIVISITDLLQAGHCEGAWQQEAPILEAIQKAKHGSYD